MGRFWMICASFVMVFGNASISQASWVDFWIKPQTTLPEDFKLNPDQKIVFDVGFSYSSDKTLQGILGYSTSRFVVRYDKSDCWSVTSQYVLDNTYFNPYYCEINDTQKVLRTWGNENLNSSSNLNAAPHFEYEFYPSQAVPDSSSKSFKFATITLTALKKDHYDPPYVDEIFKLGVFNGQISNDQSASSFVGSYNLGGLSSQSIISIGNEYGTANEIRVTVTPEPSTWAAIGGIGLIGAAWRCRGTNRRKQR